MIVTSGAAQPLTEQRHADVVRDVVEILLPRDGGDGHSGVLPRSHPQKSNGDRHLRVVSVKLIAGELLDDEAIERLIGVEAANDVIAIAPGIWPLKIIREAGRVGVANHIEPMPG